MNILKALGSVYVSVCLLYMIVVLYNERKDILKQLKSDCRKNIIKDLIIFFVLVPFTPITLTVQELIEEYDD